MYNWITCTTTCCSCLRELRCRRSYPSHSHHAGHCVRHSIQVRYAIVLISSSSTFCTAFADVSATEIKYECDLLLLTENVQRLYVCLLHANTIYVLLHVVCMTIQAIRCLYSTLYWHQQLCTQLSWERRCRANVLHSTCNYNYDVQQQQYLYLMRLRYL